MSNYTHGEMIHRYLELRSIKEELEAKIDTIKLNMKLIESAFLEEFIKDGVQSLSTKEGIAFRTSTNSVTTQNKTDFTRFALVNETYLDARPLKDPAVAYLQETGVPPPGLKIETIYKVNVRTK